MWMWQAGIFFVLTKYSPLGCFRHKQIFDNGYISLYSVFVWLVEALRYNLYIFYNDYFLQPGSISYPMGNLVIK